MGNPLTMTLSIRVAIHPDDGNNASELLRQADAAMFYAKNNGRNTFVYYTESMNRNAARRLINRAANVWSIGTRRVLFALSTAN